METKIVKIKKKMYDNMISDYTVFKWNIVSKEEKGDNYLIKLERDETMKNYDQYVSYEKEWQSFKIPSIIPTIVLAIVAILFFSGFLIGMFLMDSLTIPFLAFLLPGIVIFLGAAVTLLLWFNKISKLSATAAQKKAEILRKVSEIEN